MNRRSAAVVLVMWLGAAAACGRTATALPEDEGDGAVGRGDAAGKDGRGDGGGGDGGGGGGGAMDAPVDGGPPGRDAPARPDGPGIPDVLPDVSFVDAPPPSPGKIDCGPTACDPSKQICCATLFGGTAVQVCLPAGTPCPGIGKACDGREDCPMGELCCIESPTGMSLPTATCSPTPTCGGGGMGTPTGFALCHTGADCPQDSPYCCGLSVLGATLAVCTPVRC